MKAKTKTKSNLWEAGGKPLLFYCKKKELCGNIARANLFLTSYEFASYKHYSIHFYFMQVFFIYSKKFFLLQLLAFRTIALLNLKNLLTFTFFCYKISTSLREKKRRS